MELHAIGQSAAQKAAEAGDAELERERQKLRQACRDFEGVFVGILLKEGLKPDESFDEEDSMKGAASLHELAVETVAQQMGAEGAVGLGDMMYEQMTMNLGNLRYDR